MIEYNTILDVTDDEGAIHLIINMKYTVIVSEPVSPIQNTPHSKSLVFYKNFIRYYKYNTEAATDHYF